MALAFVLEDVFRESVKAVNSMLEEKHISILFETSIERMDATPLGKSYNLPYFIITLPQTNPNPTLTES